MTSATRQRPAPGLAGNEFSDGDEVVDIAREVDDALQHTPWELANRVPIRVLALQLAADERERLPPALESARQFSARRWSARLQAGTVNSRTCSPEGERYKCASNALPHRLLASRAISSHARVLTLR